MGKLTRLFFVGPESHLICVRKLFRLVSDYGRPLSSFPVRLGPNWCSVFDYTEPLSLLCAALRHLLGFDHLFSVKSSHVIVTLCPHPGVFFTQNLSSVSPNSFATSSFSILRLFKTGCSTFSLLVSRLLRSITAWVLSQPNLTRREYSFLA